MSAFNKDRMSTQVGLKQMTNPAHHIGREADDPGDDGFTFPERWE